MSSGRRLQLRTLKTPPSASQHTQRLRRIDSLLMMESLMTTAHRQQSTRLIGAYRRLETHSKWLCLIEIRRCRSHLNHPTRRDMYLRDKAHRLLCWTRTRIDRALSFKRLELSQKHRWIRRWTRTHESRAQIAPLHPSKIRQPQIYPLHRPRGPRRLGQTHLSDLTWTMIRTSATSSSSCTINRTCSPQGQTTHTSATYLSARGASSPRCRPIWTPC
jgi:hypothetical protein